MQLEKKQSTRAEKCALVRRVTANRSHIGLVFIPTPFATTDQQKNGPACRNVRARPVFAVCLGVFLSSPSLSRTSVLCMSTLPRWKSRWMSVRTRHMATILTTGHTHKKNHLKCVSAIGHRSRRGVCTVFLIHWSRTFCLFALVCVVNARKARLWNEYNVCCRLYYCLLFWKSNTMRMTKSMTRNGIYARRYTNRRWHRLGVYYAYTVSPTKGRRINNSASIGIIVIDNL